MFAITERLLLRPCWPEDAEILYRAIADECIVRNLATVPWPYAREDAREFAALEHSELFPTSSLWLRTGSTPVLVGACGLAECDGEAELGYWIARAHWERGYATEAARAMVAAGRAIGHRRIVSGHFIDNPASGRVLRKAGFRSTGKIELRASRSRGANVPCALFELECDVAQDGAVGPVMASRRNGDGRMQASDLRAA